MNGADALERELGAPPPPGLVVTLDPGDLERLARSIGTARREQSRALAEAAEEALRHVPALLRGPVRKIAGL